MPIFEYKCSQCGFVNEVLVKSGSAKGPACPSHVMQSYLEEKKPVPDCFACGVCIETCPTQAIRFAAKSPSKTRRQDLPK